MTCKHLQISYASRSHTSKYDDGLTFKRDTVTSNRHRVVFLLLCVTFLAFHSSAIEVSVLLEHCAMSVGT